MSFRTYKPELNATAVIPFHNGLDHLYRTLAGLANQSYPRDLIDAIVVTDGEIPQPPKFIRKLLRLRTITMPFRGYRPATSRNIGIQHATGDVILSLDFDMICHPQTIEEHLKIFHQNPRVATIGHRKFVDANILTPWDVLKEPETLQRLPKVRSISNTSGGYYDKRLPEFTFFRKHKYPFNCFHGCNVAYFRDDAIDAGNWNTAFDGVYGYEDLEFGLRLWENNVELVYNELAYAYHQENRVVSRHKKARDRQFNLEKLYGAIPKLRDYRRKLAMLVGR